MTNGSEMTWFPTKVDWWLALILVFMVLVTFGGLVVTLVVGEGVIVSLIASAFVVALLGGLIYPMEYGIGGGELVVRHGLMRQRCRLDEIIEVYPTHNPLSSPALSLDRLMIKKGERFRDAVMISPADKEGFLALLAERAGLERDGERLVRPT